AMLAQQLLNGLVVGAVYALFSLGLTLVFGMHRILNLAHGAVFMWGAFIGYFAVTLGGLPLWAAFIIAVIGAGMVSVALDLFVFRPLRRHQGDEFGTIVASIGANLILMQLAQQATNAQTLRFPFGIFPILFYDIAGMLAGAAGVILGVAFNSVSYVMGDAVMLQAFVVIVLGGLGSVTGAVLAGILIGMIQTLTTAYISTELSDAVVFGLLFVVLLIRPDGFFAGLHTEYRVA